MKTANKILLIAFGLIILTIIAILISIRVELSKPIIEGSGNMIEIERELAVFESINIKGPIAVTLQQNGAHTISIIADDNIANLVETNVRNNRLNIKLKEPVHRDTRITVEVSVSDISEINASAGAKISAGNALRGDNLGHELRSGANSSLELYFNEMKLNVQGGASTVLHGRIDILEANSTAGANINAKDLKVQACHVTGSKGAQSSFFVSGSLHVNAKSGAVVSYTGNPAVKVWKTSFGGSIVEF